MTMLRLRLRTWLGWGGAPDDLRLQSEVLVRAAWVSAVWGGLLLPLIFFLVGLFYAPLGAFFHALLTTPLDSCMARSSSPPHSTLRSQRYPTDGLRAEQTG